MIELEQEDPIPQGDLALQITALPRETNGFGDIFGGWLVAQMDLAGTAMASKVAGGRVATVEPSWIRWAMLLPIMGAQCLLLGNLPTEEQLHSLQRRLSDMGMPSVQVEAQEWLAGRS